MPTSEPSIDLDNWSDFQPVERPNDFEYNLLLYKYKSLFNEVKNFQDTRGQASVSRITLNSPEADKKNSQAGQSGTKNGCLSTPSNGRNSDTNVTTTNLSTGLASLDISAKRSYFQHQNSMPTNVPALRNQFLANNDQQINRYNSKQIQQGNQKQYNSSHNLLLINNSSVAQNLSAKPEIKQRNQAISSRFSISKSSERLDNILNANYNDNNNHVSAISAFKANQPATFNPKHISPLIARDPKYLQNDSNIYDAVSPDDMSGAELTSHEMTSSIYNINRLSLPQKPKLESSKSVLGLGSSFDQGKTFSSQQNRLTSDSNRTFKDQAENRDQSSNSLGSSLILDASNNTSSSLSIINGLPIKDRCDSPQYANYVNIDFFLKRGQSHSMDDLEENAIGDDTSDASGEDTTQMSNSFSSDHLCEDALKDLSPRELAKKLSSKVNTNSSSSLTPASSGDFIDENRSSSLINQRSTPNSRFVEANNKLASFFSLNSRDQELLGSERRNSRNKLEESMTNSLRPIHESSNSMMSGQHMSSLEDFGRQDVNALSEAHSTMKSFLTDLNLSPVDDVFEDKAQRRIVKESFAVEFCGRRKLRHLFLFNDVIVCAKYQASSKQKFTFDVKWYLTLNGVTILDQNDTNVQVKYDKEAMENQILAIRTNLMLMRGQMQQLKRSKHKQPSKVIKKLKKKRTELEAELVLLLPHLPLLIKHTNGKKYTFFLSSNFDRNQWVESIRFLQSQLSISKSITSSPSSSELQAWIQTCRKNLNPSLGTFLLRSNCDDDLLYGDLYINLISVNGLTKPGSYHFCFEVDSYGHFSQKASSSVLRIEGHEHHLNDEYVFPLDGAHTLRIILYENIGSSSKPCVIGKAHVELSRAWFLDKPVDKIIVFNSNCSIAVKLSHSSSELLSMKIPHAKLCPSFSMDITQVCKKEKTNVPLLMQLCVNEVERRGMREVGIYRMSGTSTDIQRLKKAFETNPFIAELLLRDIDINSVTGFLKTYLREMPEGLFINKLYLKFVAAFNIPQTETLERTKKMLELFHKIPITNQHTIIYLVEHLVKVNTYESYNKMSLTNLATVIGPNILRQPADCSEPSSGDPFTAVVIGSMSQAGILYFFLERKASGLPLTELDPSELQAHGPRS